MNRILHTTDMSPGSDVAFAHAVKLALATRSRLDVVLLATADKVIDGDSPQSMGSTLHQWGILPSLVGNQDLGQLGFKVREVVIDSDDPIEPLNVRGDEAPIDLVVQRRLRNRESDQWLRLDVTERLIAGGSPMKLLLPEGADGVVDKKSGELRLASVLIQVDLMGPSATAIDATCDLLEALGPAELSLNLLQMAPSYEADLPAPAVREHDTWTWRRHQSAGSVVEEVLRVAERTAADLIVMSAPGRQDILDGLREDATDQVLRFTDCPVLLVPA